MTAHDLPLAPPTPETIERRAIAAAKALHAYRVALGGADLSPDVFAAVLAHVDERQEEARGECSILGAALEDAGRGADARAAFSFAGRIRLDADRLTLADLADMEAWCRAGCHAVAPRDEARPCER